MPNILEEYCRLTDEYRNKYGHKTIVLMQCGSFYEVYAPGDERDTEQIKVCEEILGFRVSKKKEGHYMAGVNVISYKRHEKKLISNGYTIVYVDQVTNTTPAKREVTRIISPGCNLDSDNDEDDAILASVLVESDGDDWYMYMSVSDTNRGDIRIIEIEQTPGDSIERLYEKIYDLMDTYRANELLLNIISNKEIKLPNFGTSKLVHNDVISVSKAKDEILNHKNHKDLLENFFSKYHNIYEEIYDNLNLENVAKQDIGNMLLMLYFLKDHHPDFVKNLSRPKYISQSKNTELATYNNAFNKLQVFSNEKDNLMRFINKTLTCSGKKKLFYLIRHPSCEIDVLNERYDAVEFFVKNRTLLTDIKKHLHIHDLERLYRRFAIGRIDAYSDVPKIYDMNNRIITLLTIVLGYSDKPHWIPDEDIFQKFQNYSSELEAEFCIDSCRNGKGNVFNEGICPDLEELYNSYDKCFEDLENIRSDLCSLSGETIHLRNTEKDGYFFETTKKRANVLKEKIKSYIDGKLVDNLGFDSWSSSNSFEPYLSKEDAKNLKFSSNTSQVKITSDITRKKTEEIVYLKHKIDSLTNKLVKEKVIGWYEKYYDECLMIIIDSMAWMDVYYSYATVAIDWNYVRPVLVDSEDSGISAKQLRHPMIEQLLRNERIAFVPNDIVLGFDNSYLLYGVNSVGKSSLLKSVALSVIMSQSGMFVPAKEYKLTPYEKLIVRIGNSDNLFEAHSSFICEITEADKCVQYACNKTLVLADEFCASTERESATQIVTTMLQWLELKKTSYIFATHLFELLDTIGGMNCLKVIHLKIREGDNGELIFDRKITSGAPENRDYGTKVASKLFKDGVFLKMLKRNSVKRKSNVKQSRSRYNSNLFVRQCEICAYSPQNETSLPLDTHHINMQCMANSDGFIDNFHKNNMHNLVVLCKQCHVKVHSGELTNLSWEQRETGPKLNYVNSTISLISN
jgi:DNA mismatch repair protein MutS